MNKIISILHVSYCIGLFIGVVVFAQTNSYFSSLKSKMWLSNSQLVEMKKCEIEIVFSAFEKGNFVFKMSILNVCRCLRHVVAIADFALSNSDFTSTKTK
jgi:hypothetical protein